MLDFVYINSGLEVQFRVLSKVPAKAILDWDFGDDKGEVFNGKRLQNYSYETSGFYQVTLHVTDSKGLDESVTKTVVICDYGFNTLPDSIYNLIDNYIPKEIYDKLTPDDKAMYIQKWQLYIGPLVNHLIPKDKYKDELWYDALENQLIMELAAFDFMQVTLLNMLTTVGNHIMSSTSSSSDSTEEGGNSGEIGNIKQVTTGPTEVQYYDSSPGSASDFMKTFTNSLKPGGVVDELRKNLCMLAERLEIYLPFCNQPFQPVIPKVVNHRQPGPFDGPNPTTPLKQPTLIKK